MSGCQAGAGAPEETTRDAVRTPQTPGIDGNVLGELMRHWPPKLERRNKLAIEPLELFALLVEE